jgi:hypothetical protein
LLESIDALFGRVIAPVVEPLLYIVVVEI